MAWTVPKTWTSGAVTAGEFNEQIRDNSDWLKDALTLHGITSDSVVGALLTARYGVSAAITNFSVPTATDKAVDFTAADEWDDDNFHDPATSNDRFYIPDDGTYLLIGHALFEADEDGYRQVFIRKNDGSDYNKVSVPSLGPTVRTGITTSIEMELVTDDYLNLRCRHSAGGALDVDARFSVRRIAN